MKSTFLFCSTFILGALPPPLISIPYALRQHNINSAGVQNSVIICLFKKYCVNFLYCYVPVPFKSSRLSLFKCMLICFVFFYNCPGILVGQSFLFDPSSFPSAFPSRIFCKIYSTLQCSIFVGLPSKACDMSLRDVQTIHVSNMLARDSVILAVSASKIVRIYCLQVHLYIIEG